MYPWQFVFWGAVAVLSLFSNSISAQERLTDSSTGKNFPSQVTVEYEDKPHTLQATGVSTRKKFFVKVYSIAHYMEEPQKRGSESIFNEILDSKKIKQLTFIWVHEADVKRVQDGYRESFNKAIPRNEMPQLRSAVDEYIGYFNHPIKSGDQHVLRWFPNGTVTVEINGQKRGTIKNEAFARGLWSIWFGKSSVVNRNELVSRIR